MIVGGGIGFSPGLMTTASQAIQAQPWWQEAAQAAAQGAAAAVLQKTAPPPPPPKKFPWALALGIPVAVIAGFALIDRADAPRRNPCGSRYR